MNKPKPITLTESEEVELESIANNAFAPAIMRKRAQIILAAADGDTHPVIAEKLNAGTASVQRWISKFRNRPEGIEMKELLRTGEGRGRKRTYGDEAREWICQVAKEHKSECTSIPAFTKLVNQMAEEAGFPELSNCSSATVGNILRENGLS